MDRKLCRADRNFCRTDRNFCRATRNFCRMDRNLCRTDRNFCPPTRSFCRPERNASRSERYVSNLPVCRFDPVLSGPWTRRPKKAALPLPIRVIEGRALEVVEQLIVTAPRHAAELHFPPLAGRTRGADDDLPRTSLDLDILGQVRLIEKRLRNPSSLRIA